MRDLNGLADLVVLTIKNAMAPVLERLAVSDTKVAAIEARLSAPDPLEAAMAKAVQTVDELRSQLQTKAAETAAAFAALAELTKEVASLRDRTLVVETKTAADETASLVDDLRDRLVTLDTRTAGPSLADMAITDIRAKLATVEAKLFDDTQTKSIAAVSERLAIVETKGAMPGPAGPSGKDGIDGLGFDDLAVEHDGDRTVVIKAVKGDRVKVVGSITIPADIYRGVYQDGKAYERGDGVTWGGSEWHCNEATSSKPGDGSKAWTLKVKRGRDGRDGRDAATVPVVSIARPS